MSTRIEIKNKVSTGWQRNPDWLPLPEITAADNRFVGLFLVFEEEYNQLTVQAQPTVYQQKFLF